jgi:hypothetical protein
LFIKKCSPLSIFAVLDCVCDSDAVMDDNREGIDRDGIDRDNEHVEEPGTSTAASIPVAHTYQRGTRAQSLRPQTRSMGLVVEEQEMCRCKVQSSRYYSTIFYFILC